MKYNEYSFKDLLSAIVDNRGKTCPIVESGIPLIATNCIKNDHLYPTYDKIRYVSQETYEIWFRGHPEPGDMIFVCKGSPGRVSWVPDPIEFCIAQDMLAIRADETKVYPEYLFALLRSEATQKQIENMHVGTLIPHFKKSDFGKLLLQIPDDYEYQKMVGDNYFKFCEKIELNRQINQTLESMAQAIFKSWFVDFDPVKAKIAAIEAGEDAEGVTRAAMRAISGKTDDELDKMEGGQPENYAKLKTTAGLFPSAMQETELGEVPEGWKAGNFKDCCGRVESGGTPKRSEESYWGGNIKWLASGEVRDVIVLDTKEKITEEGLKNSSAKLWPKGTTVVAMYGATAGQVCMISSEMSANQACCALIPKPDFESYIFFSARNAVSSLSDRASGSAQQNLNKSLVANYECLIPEIDVMKQFENSMSPFLDKWRHNEAESVILSQLCDTLLPKLLSGEIRMSMEEKIAEDKL